MTSQANEVQPAAWRRASCCAGGECIEVMQQEQGTILLRNSSEPSLVISATIQEWNAFAGAMRAGEFRDLT